MPVSSSENLGTLEADLRYSFHHRALLLEALTHKSFHHENPSRGPSHNERLEFIGDSVLGLVIVEHLFHNKMGYTESEMSEIKSYLVRGSLLAEIAQDVQLGNYLRLGKGEEETGGRNKKSVLANAMEALLGAVYLDGGYGAAQELILRLYGGRVLSALSSGQYHNYKTDLQEESQMRLGILPEYHIIHQEGEEHRKTFTAEVFLAGKKLGRGSGKNKKEAQTAAAKEALERLLSGESPS
jgi:ribonuclease-3